MSLDEMLEELGNSIVRRKLNDAFGDPSVNPDNLVLAIEGDVSLWEAGKEEISKKASGFHPMIISMASEYVDRIESRYGGFTELTLKFLKEDHMELYSVIINTPGGREWLDRQVKEILKGIGILK